MHREKQGPVKLQTRYIITPTMDRHNDRVLYKSLGRDMLVQGVWQRPRIVQRKMDDRVRIVVDPTMYGAGNAE